MHLARHCATRSGDPISSSEIPLWMNKTHTNITTIVSFSMIVPSAIADKKYGGKSSEGATKLGQILAKRGRTCRIVLSGGGKIRRKLSGKCRENRDENIGKCRVEVIWEKMHQDTEHRSIDVFARMKMLIERAETTQNPHKKTRTARGGRRCQTDSRGGKVERECEVPRHPSDSSTDKVQVENRPFQRCRRGAVRSVALQWWGLWFWH